MQQKLVTDIVIENIPIPEVSNTRFLGVYIDQHLKWKFLKKTCKKYWHNKKNCLSSSNTCSKKPLLHSIIPLLNLL